MSNLINFSYEKNNLRTEIINNEPYFCLKDVCDILEIGNPSQLSTRLDGMGVIQNETLTKGGKQQLIFINEANLYRVIFRSDKQEAQKFQDWVFNEVLPSIRKTGEYKTDNLIQPIPGIEKELIVVKYTKDLLRISNTGTILLLEKVCKNNNVPTNILPEYDDKEPLTFSLTELLKKNSIHLNSF